MRIKYFVMSMGLAASVWLTGCKTTTPCKNGSCGANNAPAACKTGCKDGCGKDMAAAPEKTEKTTRHAGRWKGPVSTVPPAACTTCTKCGHKCGANETAANSNDVVAANCSCQAKTGSVVSPNQVAPQNGTLPAGVIPTQTLPATIPPSVQSLAPPPVVNQMIQTLPNEPMVVQQSPAPSNYGPGVEVVGNQPVGIMPAPTTLPGQPIASANNNVITVRFGQINNYGEVVGQVYQFRRAWKLRYTAVESDDKYGGSLTLVGDNLDNLKDGQIVKVQGVVLPSDDRASGARYQVGRVEVLEPDVK